MLLWLLLLEHLQGYVGRDDVLIDSLTVRDSGGTKILILGSPNNYMCIISYALYKSLLNY